MTYRRRAGRRAKGRKKVTRAELVKFWKEAGRRERQRIAEQRAEALARWIKRFLVAVAVIALVLLYWKSS